MPVEKFVPGAVLGRDLVCLTDIEFGIRIVADRCSGEGGGAELLGVLEAGRVWYRFWSWVGRGAVVDKGEGAGGVECNCRVSLGATFTTWPFLVTSLTNLSALVCLESRLGVSGGAIIDEGMGVDGVEHTFRVSLGLTFSASLPSVTSPRTFSATIVLTYMSGPGDEARSREDICTTGSGLPRSVCDEMLPCCLNIFSPSPCQVGSFILVC